MPPEHTISAPDPVPAGRPCAGHPSITVRVRHRDLKLFLATPAPPGSAKPGAEIVNDDEPAD